MFIWGNFPDNHYLKITRTRPGGCLILGPGSHGKSDWENWMRSTEVSWNRWNGLPWKILHVQLGCSIFNEPSSYVCDKGLAPWPYGNLAVSVSVSAEKYRHKNTKSQGSPCWIFGQKTRGIPSTGFFQPSQTSSDRSTSTTFLAKNPHQIHSFHSYFLFLIKYIRNLDLILSNVFF